MSGPAGTRGPRVQAPAEAETGNGNATAQNQISRQKVHRKHLG